jgi:hypothetical protein
MQHRDNYFVLYLHRRITLGNMSNLGSMNCQKKVVILDLNCDFRMIKKIYNHKRQLFCTLFTSL